MPHVLIAGKLHEDGLALLDGAAGVTHDYIEEISEASCARLAPKADAILLRTQPLSAATIEAAPRLRIVSRHGVGYDNVDLAALNARGAALAVVGDVNSSAVAEHTLMLMLAASRRLVRADRATRDGGWEWRNRFEPRELEGRVVAVIGFGRIGRKVARLCAAFGMAVRVHDPFAAELDGVKAAPTLEAALDGAHFLTLHAPSGAAAIGAAELARLAPGAVVVNASRGGLIDEAALADALASGQVFAAGLDVFAEEPPVCRALLDDDSVVLTPHIAGLTQECAARMAVVAMRNILDFFDGRIDRRLVVNADAIGL